MPHILSDFVFASISQDKQLKNLVSTRKKNGPKNSPIDWERIASQMGTFSAEVCKKRFQYLKAQQAGSGPWTKGEDEKITEMVKFHGKLHATMALKELL